MTIDDKMKYEKLHYNINKEAAKISTLSSCEIDKCEYLTGKEILLSDQNSIIKQAKFTYSPLGKASTKQMKTIEDQWVKQVEALKALIPMENKDDIKSIKDLKLKAENY